MTPAALLTRLRDALAGGVRAYRRARLPPEPQIEITSDDREIVCAYPGGTVRRAQWSDLTAVRIRTTSDGPFLPDVLWGLHAGGREPAIIYPLGATGDGALLSAMQRRLPGFDNEAVVRAMCSAEDAWFVVWRGPRERDGRRGPGPTSEDPEEPLHA